MRKFIYLLFLVTLLTPTFSSCDLFSKNEEEIEELKKRQEELEKRIAALETWQNAVNSDIAALKQLTEASISGKVIISCEDFTNETGSGYRITFSDNSVIHIYHGLKGDTGANGADGKPGNNPMVGVKEFDGTLYYVQQIGSAEPTFILDAAGHKVPVASGGITVQAPVIGIDGAGYWTIDLRDNAGPTRIKDANGNFVQATGSGVGDSVFEKILFTDTSIEFFLRTGGSFIVKREPGGDEIRLATAAMPDFSTTNVYEIFYFGDKVGLVCRELVPYRSKSEMSTVIYPYNKTSGYGAGIILESGNKINFDGSNPLPGTPISQSPTSITLMGTGELRPTTYAPAGTDNFATTELFIEDSDNNFYPLIKVAGTIWMAENLRTLSYNDSTPIPTNLAPADMNGGKNQTLAACVPYGSYNARSEDPAVKQTIQNYGILYNGVVMNSGKIAPKGSHVATRAEWETMFAYISASKIKIGAEFFTPLLWKGGVGTNITGFGIPGGGDRADTAFELEGSGVYYWAINNTSAFYITQNLSTNNIVWTSIRTVGRCMYVRCAIN